MRPSQPATNPLLPSKRMTALSLLMGLLLLGGCIGPIGESSSVDGGYAPVIDSSFPSGSGSEQIAMAGSARFSAAGEDPDSLDLEWQWRLDGELMALGDADDGRFDTELEVFWTDEQSGSLSELRFTVSNGNFETELLWALSFE